MSTDTASMARLLNALRGGNWALEAERQAAGEILGAWPKAPDALRWLGRYRSAVAADAARRGIGTVVFAGEGFPLGDPPHLAAARASAAARFWYADPNSAVAGQRRISLDGDGRAQAVAADVRDPAALIGAIGEDGPVQVQWGLAAMGLDYAGAADLAAGYAKLLAPGSELVIAVPDGDGGRRLAEIAGGFPHDALDISAWCAEAGLELPRGRASDVRAWGRAELAGKLSGRSGRIVAAVARVP